MYYPCDLFPFLVSFFSCSVLPSYLEIIFFVDRKAVREDIACNNHVGLISIHGEPIHPQKLRQQRVAMALHDELRRETKEYQFTALL